MQRGPNSSALRAPAHFFTGRGSRHRRLPTGGWAKGMPLKLRTPSLGAALASRAPLAVLTRSAADAVKARIAEKSNDREVFMRFIVFEIGKKFSSRPLT